MRIEVSQNKLFVEGYCNHPCSRYEDNVISFSRSGTEWFISGSRCLPNNLESAKIILECMNKTFEKVLELQKEENNQEGQLK